MISTCFSIVDALPLLMPDQLITFKVSIRSKCSFHNISPSALVLSLRPEDNGEVQISDSGKTIIVPEITPRIVSNTIFQQCVKVQPHELHLHLRSSFRKTSASYKKGEITSSKIDVPQLPVKDPGLFFVRITRIEKVPPVRISMGDR